MNRTVIDAATARAFLHELAAAGWLYHPEDSAADCLADHNLPPETIAAIQHNMRATFRYLDDPCEVALEILDEEDP